jgi:hypothetical protein
MELVLGGMLVLVVLFVALAGFIGTSDLLEIKSIGAALAAVMSICRFLLAEHVRRTKGRHVS